MARTPRPPRVWIDFECGALPGSAAASLRVFREYRTQFGPFRQAWLFGSNQAPLARGFYFPPNSHSRFALSPESRGPHGVLIDDRGDQLWLDGVACGPDAERAPAAATVLREAGFELPATAADARPLAEYDEMHFRDGRLATSRAAGAAVPVSPAGRTMVLNGRLVNRMEFDGGPTTAADLWSLWTRATESGAWLGRPTSLILYDSRLRSEDAGHTGCQLIAAGETGRELWLVLPEPDDYERLSNLPRRQYQGSYVEYQGVVRNILRSVDSRIDHEAARTWWQRLLGQHELPPAVIRWPERD